MQDFSLHIASKDSVDVQSLCVMINKVYRKAEDDIWQKNHERISIDRLTEIIEKEELLLAKNNKAIAGCIHLEPVNTDLYKFKMLAANPQFKGMGVGSVLVKFAEKTAIERGALKMQLELLVPTEFNHPEKVFLHNWYSRIGYREISEHSVDYCHEGISKFLKTPCKAVVYQKPLVLLK